MSLYNIINLNVGTASSTFSIPSTANKSFSIINLIVENNTTTENTILLNFATQLSGSGFKIIVSALSTAIQPVTYSAALTLQYNGAAFPSSMPSSISYGDYIYITYNNNQWSYISSASDLIHNELKYLGASDADSDSNPLLTRESLNSANGTNMLKESLSEGGYLDGTLSSDGKLVTVKLLPYDLYKYLDVSFTDKYGANSLNRLGSTSDSNKLESIDSLNYLNQFLLIMQNNPTFYQAVINELTIQNSLNEINVPVNSLLTLTYPAIINKSTYFGDIILQATSNSTTTYSPINKLILDTNSKILYLGSNIDIQPASPFSTTDNFKLYYYTTTYGGTSTQPELYTNTNIQLSATTVSSSVVSVTFLVVAISTPQSSTPMLGINGIFLYNGENTIIQNTVTSLYQSPNVTYAAIKYTYSSPILSPILLCIINSKNDILYNSANPIYINTTPPDTLLYDSTILYNGPATLSYSTNGSNQVYYNAQNIVLNDSNNSITFYINNSPAILLTSIILGYQITVPDPDPRRPDITTIEPILYTSANITSNSITVYYSSSEAALIASHTLYIYFYSNGETSSWYQMINNPIYINNSMTPAPFPEAPDSSGCYMYSLSTTLEPNPPPATSYSVYTNTIATFTVTTCDVSMNSNYIFELGYMNTSVFTSVPSNLIITSENVVSLVLYDYTGLPPSVTAYNMCVSIRIPPNGTPYNGGFYYIVTNLLSLIISAQISPTVPPSPLPPAPPSPIPSPSGTLISVSAQNSVSALNFPVTGTTQNPYSVIQGNIISFFIYSTTSFVESIIYFNGYELSYYTQATDSSNTYFGGSKSYVNTIQLKTPFTKGGFAYYYYTTVSIKITLPIDIYYITVANKFLSTSGQDTILYSLNNIYLNVAEQTNLVVQGNLVNGVIISPLIHITPEAYATVNGHILLPNKSLYAYQTKINGVNTTGYFYVITGNTVNNDSDALSGASQTGLICFEGQGNGTILINQTPKIYNSIINNMLLYFKRLSNAFGFGLSSEIASILNTKLATVEQNIYNVIQNIEYTARNVYLVGIYTTNIYINGNSLPVGTSYYPNGVTYQGPTGSIPPPPASTAPNPDVNVYNGISYLAVNVPTPPPAIGTPGQYWGVNIKNCSTGQLTLQQPNNWGPISNVPLPSGLTTTSSPVGDFRGVNSFNALNNLFEGDTASYKIEYSCKNVIIIPSNYVGYGIIDSSTTQEPPYILSIILNTSTPVTPVSNCDCNQSQATLNGDSIAVGTEVMLVNNSTMNIRIASFNTTTSTPIQINLKDTTMDTLFVKSAESMHLVFGGETWGVM